MRETIPLQQASGLHPQTWVIVGGGYSREEVKGLFFKKGLSLTSQAVTSLEDLARVVLAVDKKSILDSPARQEVLRSLLSDHRIISQFPEIRNLKRQSGFFRKLDQALQQGRMAFSHPEECIVFHERLALKRGGRNVLREELMQLSLAFETWLGVKRFWDPPLLFRSATELLDHSGWPTHLEKPEKLFFVNAHKLEGAQTTWIEALSRHCVFETSQSEGGDATPATPFLPDWRRFHTLDDACDALADEIVEGGDLLLESLNVLIPDLPPLRRSLVRALHERGIPLADTRDPTRLRWDEQVKWALMPLELVSSRFERSKVLAWIWSPFCPAEVDQKTLWMKELNSRAYRRDLNFLKGGVLESLRVELETFVKGFQGRNLMGQWEETHLGFLSRFPFQFETLQIGFWESLWQALMGDLERVGSGEKKWPVQMVTERLRNRLQEMSPPVVKEKPKKGLRIFRLQQAPLDLPDHAVLWLLGVPPRWLSEENFGDYWWSVRDREVLGSEFTIRSAIDISNERQSILKQWMNACQQTVVWDGEYEWDGRERESLTAFFRQLGIAPECVTSGAYLRWKKSFQSQMVAPPREVCLSPEGREITATTLDRYSRCPFQALAYHRWKLRDLDDPEMELWPHVKGNLLHAAVRYLLQSRETQPLTASEAVEKAWKRRPPEGLFRSQRIEWAAKQRLVKVIEKFIEKENEFQSRAQTKSVSLEDMKFRWEKNKNGAAITLIGEPDRIEEHKDGLFIADYKTSSSLPSGQDMVGLGYRLQLPFYALATQDSLKKPVIGVQLIELTPRASRSNGIFFKKWNGKEQGCLSNLRSNSKSLFLEEPEEIWEKMEEVVLNKASDYLEGKFDVKPVRPDKECRTCQVADLCGIRRTGEDS